MENMSRHEAESSERCEVDSFVDKFYKDLECNNLDFKLCQTEVEELHTAIWEVISEIMAEATQHDRRFTFSEILSVGSFAEKTKIVEPNEFDFLCILEDLSLPGMLKLKKVCDNNPGHAHIFVESEQMKEKFKAFIDEGQLVAKKLFVELSNIISSVYLKYTNTINADRKKGRLTLGGFSVMDKGPNTVLHLYWTQRSGQKLDISVDISPGIRYHNIKDVLNPTDALYPKFIDEIKKEGSVLLVPSSVHKTVNRCNSKCFRISCTELEVRIINSLSTKHKTCYKILKYITGHLCRNLSVSKLTYPPLSSFILKMAVIHHSVHCNGIGTKITCIEDVIDILLASMCSDEGPNMSNIFFKEHNLLSKLGFFQIHDITAMTFVMHVQVLNGLKELQNELNQIQSDDYNFEKGIEKLNLFIRRLDEIKNDIYNAFYEQYKANGRWNFGENTPKMMIDLFNFPVRIFK